MLIQNRFIVHNGEINTILGNADKMLAREETMGIRTVKRRTSQSTSGYQCQRFDSAMLDNTLEFLVMSGMELPLAVMITIPEPWANNRYISEKKKRLLSILCNNDGAMGWPGFHFFSQMVICWCCA